jgi:ATP:corrinoid adenosyltransferase
MIEEESEQWISEFHPTIEKEVLEVLRSRVQYAILDQLNYMISNHIANPNEVKKIVLNEITEITNEGIQVDLDEN